LYSVKNYHIISYHITSQSLAMAPFMRSTGAPRTTNIRPMPIPKHAVGLIKQKCDNNQNPGRQV